jgi:hypothetical protein
MTRIGIYPKVHSTRTRIMPAAGRRRWRIPLRCWLIAALCAVAVVPVAGARDIVRPHRVIDKGLEILLPSGGCTSERDFVAAVDPANTARLLLKRLRRDDCKAFHPDGLWIPFSSPPVGPDAARALTVIEIVP